MEGWYHEKLCEMGAQRMVVKIASFAGKYLVACDAKLMCGQLFEFGARQIPNIGFAKRKPS